MTYVSRSYLYHCVWSRITVRISLQTTTDRQMSRTRLHLRLRAFVVDDVHCTVAIVSEIVV